MTGRKRKKPQNDEKFGVKGKNHKGSFTLPFLTGKFGSHYCSTFQGGGGHSNTTVVHMRDQRFSKQTLIAIYPLPEKHPN